MVPLNAFPRYESISLAIFVFVADRIIIQDKQLAVNNMSYVTICYFAIRNTTYTRRYEDAIQGCTVYVYAWGVLITIKL